ncbi:hypothetical protein ATE84_0916 [Aquimarina sp. MAR_2010_214]|uniref:hypothetical protein n=1 Tax=Aquimarina sp. MAR_2010_214 TaxID=1250026 RepID=UPI000C7124E5|nr:hypothetical protein [Aquimarina sp. MAR_2010_214]PKV48900.1 hypothetical protein ATE84_0916 [Aquimarina sp. MAR_2010_214]
MNKILYILIVIGLFSCKSNSIAQEKETKTEKTKPKVEKPKFSDLQDNTIDPNTVHLIAVIQHVTKNVSICEKSFKTTTTVKVKQIINSGSGIVNMISSGQEITFGFMNSPANDFDTLKQRIPKDKEVSFTIRENPCPDMSKTVYEVIRFKTKD